MIDDFLAGYYRDLLIIQYRALSNAPQTVEQTVEVLSLADTVTAVGDGFSLVSAVGDQLDVLGKYIGLTRVQAGNPDDSEYRTLLFLALTRNSGNASLKDIDTLADSVIPVPFLLFDAGEMILTYVFAIGDKASIEDALSLGLIPKPAAVGVALAFSADPDATFGYTSNAAPVAASIVGYIFNTAPIPAGGWLFNG